MAWRLGFQRSELRQTADGQCPRSRPHRHLALASLNIGLSGASLGFHRERTTPIETERTPQPKRLCTLQRRQSRHCLEGVKRE